MLSKTATNVEILATRTMGDEEFLDVIEKLGLRPALVFLWLAHQSRVERAIAVERPEKAITFVDIKEMARVLGCERRSIRRDLTSLEKRGLLTVTTGGGFQSRLSVELHLYRADDVIAAVNYP